MVVSFDPTVYTVIEGLDGFVVLTLVRSGDISESTTVTVIIESGSALGSHLHGMTFNHCSSSICILRVALVTTVDV